MSKNKLKFISIIICIIIGMILTCTGCNKQVFDTSYTFNKIICDYGNEQFEIDIKTWRDYEGEQIQIKTYDGKVYLLSTNKCYMIGG